MNTVLMTLILLSAWSWALNQSSPATKCDAGEIDARIVASDLTGALKYSEECVALLKAEAPNKEMQWLTVREIGPAARQG
jgi:hypothetical protein